MPDVLIRDVSAEDLEEIRSAAGHQGLSLQAFLRETVHARAAYLRRQTALERAADRLHGRPAVPEEARQAVLDAIEEAHTQRAAQLSDPSDA